MLDDDHPEEPDPLFSEPEIEEPGEELGPEPPSPQGPTSPAESLPDESEVPGDLLKEFWALVLLANAALFGLTVGPMALYFGHPKVGTTLLAVGVFAALSGARRYRKVQQERESD